MAAARKGNDKGAVEGMVGFSRRTFMVPIPRFADIDALNAHLLEQCLARQTEVLRGTEGASIADRLAADQTAFMDLPATRFDACHKRARPIVMTTIAMGAGMMPLAIGFGADPSFRSPMAIAVIGGLVTSTLLSLLVVPAVFTYVDDVERLFARLGRRRRRGGSQVAAS